MTLHDVDEWIRKRIDFTQTDAIDASLNGIQVGRGDEDISTVAFAVDACLATFERAIREGAQLLFVHHGLFWGAALPLTGVLGQRIRYLMQNDLALYACHLPLDLHAEMGNNGVMAQAMGLTELQPFGDYKGRKLGVKGLLPQPLTIDELVHNTFGGWSGQMSALRYGSSEIQSVGMISGGGVREVSQAIDEGLDLYVTGDSSHNIVHECREAGMNVLFAGHYLTEVFGVKAVADAMAQELGVQVRFLDVPTGY